LKEFWDSQIYVLGGKNEFVIVGVAMGLQSSASAIYNLRSMVIGVYMD
jgi:hypothetical protein